jgi:hypothetical protein
MYLGLWMRKKRENVPPALVYVIVEPGKPVPVIVIGPEKDAPKHASSPPADFVRYLLA